ncbi:MAG: glycosyltransferase [Acidimicrobiia bacterium]|nr:glycosyltransferase [Acidimicrobiia bacterium]
MATIVLCSYVIRYPLGGVLSSNLQFLTGFARLGHDVFLVEKAGYPDSCFDPDSYVSGDDCRCGMRAVDALLRRHGLGGRWCYVSADGAYHGMERSQVEEVFARTDVFLDRGLHQTWDEESARVPVRVLLDPDPGFRQVKLENARRRGEPMPDYDAYYTYGRHIGSARSPAPTAGLPWRHVFHPVDTRLHRRTPMPRHGPFTTVMNWQSLPPVELDGTRYGMKDVEFAKFSHLPRLVDVPCEVAVEGHDVPVEQLLRDGWSVVSALETTRSFGSYADYVDASMGEFSVAKEVYSGLEVGWFSDRSAVYLARGRPVVVQDNGLDGVLPLGEGLFSVRDADEAAAAIAAIRAAPDRHAAAARRIAEEHLDTSVVLGRFLAELGVPAPVGVPGRLESTVGRSAETAGARRRDQQEGRDMEATITIGFLPRERFVLAAESLASLLEHTPEPFRLVVVDAAMPSRYRREMEAVLGGRPDVEWVSADRPLLPAESKNLVVERADTDYVCLVENDVLFTDGWLRRLVAACEELPADVATPVIREGRGEKEHFDKLLGRIVTSETTPGKLEIQRWRGLRNDVDGRTRVDLVEQHCLLFRREVFDRIGRYDEELNTRDEIDLSLALWSAGFTVVLEPASVVNYVPPSTRPEEDELDFYLNRWDLDRARRSRERIRDRWNLVETPGDLGFVLYRNLIPTLPEVRAELERLVERPGKVVLIDNGEWFGTEVTEGLPILPFPQVGPHYGGFPAGDAEALAELERVVARGATTVVVGFPAFWWFEYLPGLRERLETIGNVAVDDARLRVFDLQPVMR